MNRLTRDGTAEPVSRDQIIKHIRGQGNIHFPCSADHEQDWQPYPVDPYSAIYYVITMHTYIPSGKNPFKCHEEVLFLQPMIPPRRFDIFFTCCVGCSEGLDAFRFFFKYPIRINSSTKKTILIWCNRLFISFGVFASKLIPLKDLVFHESCLRLKGISLIKSPRL